MISYLFFLFMIGSAWIVYYLYTKSSDLEEMEIKPIPQTLHELQEKLYHTLRFYGYEVHVNEPCGRYRLEIALPQYRIAIECPGKIIPFPAMEEANHCKKEIYLQDRGWILLRFSRTMIEKHPQRILKKLEATILEMQVP